MTTGDNDYLRFSAYSIKDYITKKLTEDSKFTDQVYEGSNLAILIDIVSYMYQCLMYNINNAASESMFSDTQIYENINRLCKFIGYNPKGCSTATAIFTLSNPEESLTPIDDTKQEFEDITILPYSALDVNKYTLNGKKVYYSIKYENSRVTANSQYQLLFYNGIWKLYSTIFSGTGQNYLTITLDGLQSDSSNEKYVPSDMIDVFIEEDGVMNKWTRTDQGLFADNNVLTKSNVYNAKDKIYNVRLNENKTYELTFGNNFTGKVPSLNSKIYVFYLDTDGTEGSVTAGEIIDAHLNHSAELFGLDDELYQKIFKLNPTDTNATGRSTEFDTLCENGIWINKNASAGIVEEESVDQIRRNAPEWFKTGNRLVTTSDWEYYIKNSQFSNNVLDVKCLNNWQYVSTFYRWLYNLGIKSNNARKYLNLSKLTKNAKYSDASDVNNVYLWIKMKDQATLYTEQIDKDVQSIKMITLEPVYLTPLDVHFSICALNVESARAEYFDNDSTSTEFDPLNKSYLEITLDDNVMYSALDIQLQIAQIIRNFFNESNFTLGQIVNYNELATKILSFKQISRIRTIYHDNDTGAERIINGLSFATWTNSFIDIGDDLEVSNTSKALEPFQFPVLDKSSTILNKIKVIKKSLNSINTIQY